jgi:hypothetical protein
MTSTADEPPHEPPDDPVDPVDPAVFWALGPLPASRPKPPTVPGLDVVGRPEITVDGRNLADVLRPVYTALTTDEP